MYLQTSIYGYIHVQWPFSVLEKLSKGNDKKILIGDFDIDLLKLDSLELINKLICDLSSNCLHPQILLPTRISGKVKLSLIMCFPILLNHLLKMLSQVILLLLYLIIFHSFSFCLIFFLIIIPTREMLKYMTRADLIRTHF